MISYFNIDSEKNKRI